MTIAVLATFAVGTNIGIVNSTQVPLRYIPSQQHAIVKAAIFYGAPITEMLNTGHCETGHDDDFTDQSAIGKAGEIGAFQYFQSTWNIMSHAMGQTLDIHSFDDQVKLTAWVFANHPKWKTQWSTWRYWYGEGHDKCRA